MITLTITVAAGAAVRCGRGSAGPRKLRLTEEEIQTLTETQRQTLARHLEDDGESEPHRVHWGDPLSRYAPPVGEATLDTLRVLLDARAAAMAAQDAADLVPSSETQRRIVEAVRSISDDDARALATAILVDGPSREESRILAAARHPVIRHALAQIFQVDDLSRGGT